MECAFKQKHQWYPEDVPYSNPKLLTSEQLQKVFKAVVTHPDTRFKRQELIDWATHRQKDPETTAQLLSAIQHNLAEYNKGEVFKRVTESFNFFTTPAACLEPLGDRQV